MTRHQSSPARTGPVPASDEHRQPGWKIATGDDLVSWIGDAQRLTDDYAPVDQLLQPSSTRASQ